MYCAEQGLSVNLSVSTTKQFESESVSVAATTGCASGFLKKLVPSSHSRASLQLETSRRVYRVVQEDFTQEIEVFCMLFDRAFSIFTMTSVKKHIEYFYCRCKIQLHPPVYEYTGKGMKKSKRSVVASVFGLVVLRLLTDPP